MTFELRLVRPAEQEQQPCQPRGPDAERCQLHLIAGSIHDDALLVAEEFSYERFPSPLVLRLTTRSPPTGKARLGFSAGTGLHVVKGHGKQHMDMYNGSEYFARNTKAAGHMHAQMWNGRAARWSACGVGVRSNDA